MTAEERRILKQKISVIQRARLIKARRMTANDPHLKGMFGEINHKMDGVRQRRRKKACQMER